MTTTAPARTFTHVIVYNNGTAPLAVTTAEARSTRRSMRLGDRPDVAAIHTYHHVLAAYIRADRSATRADKTLRVLWGSPAAEEMWADRSWAAHQKLDYYGPLLNVLETVEQNVKAT